MADGKVTIKALFDGKSATEGVSKLKQALTGMSNGASKAGGIFKSVLGANLVSSAIGAGIRGINSGISSMVGELTESSRAWKTFDGNMRMIGKSDQEISRVRGSLQKFAEQSIYSASDMASTYSQMAAIGTENAEQLVKGMGGIASSAENPKQAMKTLSQQMTQALTKPKMSWQDFKLMLEQSPAGMSAVAKEMGMSTDELVRKIQDGEVSSKDFANAVAKVGTNANFSKMATEAKTVGDAMDGLREGLANRLQPAFDVFTKYGIKGINALANALDSINFDGITKSLDSALGKINFDAIIGKAKSMASQIASTAKDMWKAFADTGAVKAVGEALKSVGEAFGHVFKSASNTGVFENLASVIGKIVTKVAQATKAFADFVKSLPVGDVGDMIKGLIKLKVGLKGLKIIKGIAGLFKASKNPIEALGETVKGTGRKTSKFGSLMKQTLQGLGSFGKGILQGLGTLFQGFGKGLGSVLDGLGKGFGNVLTGLGKMSKAMNPVNMLAFAAGVALVIASLTLLATQGEGVKAILEGIGSVIRSAFSGIGDIFSSIFQGIGQGIAAIVSALGPNVDVIADMFVRTSSVVSDAMVRIVSAIAPFIPAITHMVEVVSANLPSIINAFANLVGAVGSAISQVVTAIANGATQIIGALVPLVAQIGNTVAQIIGAFGRLAMQIAQALATAVSAVANGVSQIIGALVPLVDAIGRNVDLILSAFGRLAGQLASSIDRVVTSISNGATRIINALTPLVEKVLSGTADIIRAFGDLARDVGESIAQVNESIAKIVNSCREFVDEIGNTALEIAQSFDSIVDSLKRLGEVDLLGMGLGLVALAKGIKDILNANPTEVGAGLTAISTALANTYRVSALATDFTALKTAFTGFPSLDGIASGLSGVGGALAGIFRVSALATDFTALKSAFTGFPELSTISSGLTGIGSAIGSISGISTLATNITTLQTAFTGLSAPLSSVKTAFSDLGSSITSAMTSMQSSVTSGMAGIKTAISTGMTSVKASFATTLTSMKTSVTSNMNSMQSSFTSGMNSIKSTVTSSLNSIKSSFTSSLNSMKSSVTSGVNSMKSAFTSGMNQITSAVRNGINQASSAMQSGVTRIISICRAGASGMHSAGAMMGQGLANGLMSALGAVTAAANALVRQALRAVRARAMIHSPSRLFEKEAGIYMGQGIGSGILKSKKSVTKDMNSLVDSLAQYKLNPEDLIGVGGIKLGSGRGLNIGNASSGSYNNSTTTNNSDYTINIDGTANDGSLTIDKLKALLDELTWYERQEARGL